MQPVRATSPCRIRPGAPTYSITQGVIGVVMAPDGTIVFVDLHPLATALAAGNRVMLKRFGLTPRASQLIETCWRRCSTDEGRRGDRRAD